MRDNRFRRRTERVLVDGWRETERALQAGLLPCGIYVTRSVIDDQTDPSIVDGDPPPVTQVIQAAQSTGVLKTVSPSVLEKIGYGQSARDVVAEFYQPELSLSKLKLPVNPFILVLDQIEKPGNVGAVFRCADAAAVDAIILCGDATDPFNPNAIRSSLGTVFGVPSAVATVEQTQDFLFSRDIRMLAARVESADSLWSCDLAGPLAVILGSEARGLGNRWRSINGVPIEGVRIPMAGLVDSLNVSVSAAVIAYEAMRVRR